MTTRLVSSGIVLAAGVILGTSCVSPGEPASHGTGVLSPRDARLVDLVEQAVPADIRPLFEEKYGDRTVLVKDVRRHQRELKKLAKAVGWEDRWWSDEEEWDAIGALRIILYLEQSDEAVRYRVENSCGIDRLQQWAAGILKTYEGDAFVPVSEAGLPDFGYDVSHPIHVRANRDGSRRAAWVELGGGFHRFGLVIGEAGFEPNPQRGFRFHRWADGIWGYQGP